VTIAHGTATMTVLACQSLARDPDASKQDRVGNGLRRSASLFSNSFTLAIPATEQTEALPSGGLQLSMLWKMGSVIMRVNGDD
jgi:hypothetical protein